MKYSEIMNLHNLRKVLSRLSPENINKLMDVNCEVTEKIHGENFRVGKTKDNTYFIGQKNLIFTEGQFESHPNWNKFSVQAKKDITLILDYCKSYYDTEIIFYAELCGNGLQGGFTYPFEGYNILFMDIKVGGRFWEKEKVRFLIRGLGLSYVPFIKIMKLRNAIDLDVDSMSSLLCKEPYIEGVVISPEVYPDFWNLQSRLIIKHKTKKFSENVKKGKKEKGIKNVNWMVDFKTKFSDFVTYGRFENVLSHCKEMGETVSYEMSDLKFLISAVMDDIQKEENDGVEFDNPTRRYLGKYIPIKYKEYLNERLQETLKNTEPKKVTRKRKAKKDDASISEDSSTTDSNT